MNFLFGSRQTPAERLRQHQRQITKAQRELDREKARLEQQEKKLIADIKKSARDGQPNACRIMAKDLVRTRKYVAKFVNMKTQLQAISLRMQTLSSTQQMSEAMRGATKAMKSMNRQMNLPSLQKIMMEFSMESESMDMKQNVMEETLDEVMEDGEDDEEEEERIVQQVLDEIGIKLDQDLVSAPTAKINTGVPVESARIALAEGGSTMPASAAPAGDGDLDALQARLDNLRRG